MNYIRNVLAIVMLCVVSVQAMPQSSFTRASKIITETELTPSPLSSSEVDATDSVNGPSESAEMMSSTPWPNSAESTTITDSSTDDDSSNSLTCQACKMVAGWLMSKAASETTLAEWLDSKCESTLFLSGPCKLFVANQIQKLVSFNGNANAQLCRMTVKAC